jgi:hypothetical protein
MIARAIIGCGEPPIEAEPWQARSDLDYWASRVAEGWLEFNDVVDLEATKRVVRASSAGVTEIDYELIGEKAMDDVAAAIERYAAAREPEQGPDDDE